MFPRRFSALVTQLLAAMVNSPMHAVEAVPADLVQVQQGTLPIILTVPHGGAKRYRASRSATYGACPRAGAPT